MKPIPMTTHRFFAASTASATIEPNQGTGAENENINAYDMKDQAITHAEAGGANS